ncbi:hypothetical protein CA13_49650 [Planctomycetes bacterium CA13]|uniref:Methane oxygenase PmoA n=1 Tax=Novipirellula herctigrandis TaxID=2527986 RepID=A0A5C5Z8H3_9BACT|nr:hypothetical protein CA13_49650 [Planctomycetes bacterium CA13]
MSAHKYLHLAVFGLFLMPAMANGESPLVTSKVSVKPSDAPEGWTVSDGERLFAGFIAKSGHKSVIYPIIGPGGQRMTRDYPMSDATGGEKHDHIHHRSLWFTHGDVNGIDFWGETEGCGQIIQLAGATTSDPESNVVTITTDNEWRDAANKRLLSDTRQFRFSTFDNKRIIDCEIQLKATDGDVNFGDTKEGSFGIRVAGTMKVDSKLGGKITNAEGLQDAKAWGKKSNWVDYNGPVDGDQVGITVFYHPSSFASPCYWHVRTYGLFAANPFGVHHFVGGKPTEGVTIQAGSTLRVLCRVMLYEGAFDPQQTAKDFKIYANQSGPVL